MGILYGRLQDSYRLRSTLALAMVGNMGLGMVAGTTALVGRVVGMVLGSTLVCTRALGMVRMVLGMALGKVSHTLAGMVSDKDYKNLGQIQK